MISLLAPAAALSPNLVSLHDFALGWMSPKLVSRSCDGVQLFLKCYLGSMPVQFLLIGLPPKVQGEPVVLEAEA